MVQCMMQCMLQLMVQCIVQCTWCRARRSMMHRAGWQVEPDGSEYSGQWHRGVREGEGEQRGGSGDDGSGRGAVGSAVGGLVGGEVYRGQFLADQRHGHGVLGRPQQPGSEVVHGFDVRLETRQPHLATSRRIAPHRPTDPT